MCQCDELTTLNYHAHKLLHHYTFIDKLLPGSFQTTAKISRVGHAHPDFFQGGRLPTLLPPCRRPCFTITLIVYRIQMYFTVVRRLDLAIYGVNNTHERRQRNLCSPYQRHSNFWHSHAAILCPTIFTRKIVGESH